MECTAGFEVLDGGGGNYFTLSGKIANVRFWPKAVINDDRQQSNRWPAPNHHSRRLPTLVLDHSE